MILWAPTSPSITFAEKYLPLGELCQRLSKAEGMEIRCAPGIKERKLTLFCVNKGTDEIRRIVATAAGLRWRKTEDVLFLEPDPQQVRREREIQELRKKIFARRLDEELRLRAELIGGKSYPEAIRYADEIMRERNAAYQTRTDAQRRADLERKYQAINAMTQGMKGSRQYVLAQLSRDENFRRRLLNGEAIVAYAGAPKPGTGPYSFPRLIRPIIDDERVTFRVPDTDEAFLFVATPEKGLRLASSVLNEDASSLEGALEAASLPETPADAEAVRKSPYFREFFGWGTVQDDSVLASALASPDAPLMTYERGRIGTAEQLEHLAKRASLSVCGEAFRRATHYEDKIDAKSVKDWVESFRGKSTELSYLETRTEKGWLMVRLPEPMTWRIAEPSEAAIAKLKGKAPLEESLAFARNLSPQAVGLWQTPSYERLFPPSLWRLSQSATIAGLRVLDTLGTKSPKDHSLRTVSDSTRTAIRELIQAVAIDDLISPLALMAWATNSIVPEDAVANLQTGAMGYGRDPRRASDLRNVSSVTFSSLDNDTFESLNLVLGVTPAYRVSVPLIDLKVIPPANRRSGEVEKG